MKTAKSDLCQKRDLLVECCIALNDRLKNGGDWVGGTIPECIRRWQKEYLPHITHQPSWLWVTEVHIQAAAVEMVAETQAGTGDLSQL